MPPRSSSRTTKSTAPSPAPLRQLSSRKAQETLRAAEEAAGEIPVVEAEAEAEDAEEEEEVVEEAAPVKVVKGKGKGKGKAKAVEEEVVVEEEEEVVVPEVAAEEVGAAAMGKLEVTALTPAERMAKMKELRTRMNESTAANRKALIADHQKTKVTSQQIARLAKQKKLADTLREKVDAEETGEDLERKKNWDYSIEEGERWDEKLRVKKEKSEYEFDDVDSNAQRKYVKRLTALKPDLHAYNLKKEAALGLAPGTLVPLSYKPSGSLGGLVASSGKQSQSQKQMLASSSKALSAAEELYRDASTLSYADDRPTEEAIDKVIGRMNKESAKADKEFLKRSRTEDDGDVTYINEANRVFNKKINRYFDKYTSEIRANFERGTAL